MIPAEVTDRNTTWADQLTIAWDTLSVSVAREKYPTPTEILGSNTVGDSHSGSATEKSAGSPLFMSRNGGAPLLSVVSAPLTCIHSTLQKLEVRPMMTDDELCARGWTVER